MPVVEEVSSMTELFGRSLTRQDLEKRIGHLLQVAGVRILELQEGVEKGVRVADVRTGSGLRFQISLDRGMDISAAEYKGIPLAWRSVAGDVHPAYYDSRGMEWLRGFPGGLMTGCGLSSAGAPSVDEGGEFGLHGRLSNTPAANVHARTEWQGNNCKFIVGGEIREGALFREHLLLRRAIEVELGGSVITYRDTIVNTGVRTTPLMMLYHINLGWPLIDDGATLLLNATSSTPRDAEATKGVHEARHIPAPTPGYKEQVFYHDLVADDKGLATALLENPTLRIGLFVQFRKRELKRFVQWKMVGEQEYVLGLEPANCHVSGRAKERERGTLEHLEPGEQREFLLHIGILDGSDAIQHFTHENKLQ
jgi:hypothetical protein